MIFSLPFAFIGGIWLQYFLGFNFSTAVWVGYIALFGVAVEAGIVMTTATTILALIPILLSTGAGSEIMKPIAAPTVGGMVTATLLNLIIVPVVYAWITRKG